MSSPYQKFAKDAGIVGITNVLVNLQAIILLPLLTKTLTSYEYGLWVQILVTLGLATPLLTLGLPFALVRYLAGEKNEGEIQEGVFSTGLFIFLIGSLAAGVLILLSQKFLKGYSDLIILLAAIIPLWCTTQVFLNFFRAFQRFKKLSFFSLAQIYGEVAVISYAVLAGYGLRGAVLSLLIVRTILFIAIAHYVSTRIGLKIPDFSRLRGYLVFGIPTLPGELSRWVVTSGDRYVISFFLGVMYVGFYNPAFILGNIVFVFAVPLISVLPAVLSKHFEEKRMKEVETILRYSLKYFLMLAIPAIFGLAILSKEILTILSTPEIALNGYLVAPIIAVSALMFGVYTIISQIFVLTMKTKVIATIWLVCAFLNLGLNVILIPIMGIVGAAFATLVANFTASMLAAYLSRNLLKLKIDWIFILKCLGASVGMSLIILAITPTGLLGTGLSILVGIMSYGVLLFLIKGFTKEEIRFFMRLI